MHNVNERDFHVWKTMLHCAISVQKLHRIPLSNCSLDQLLWIWFRSKSGAGCLMLALVESNALLSAFSHLVWRVSSWTDLIWSKKTATCRRKWTPGGGAHTELKQPQAHYPSFFVSLQVTCLETRIWRHSFREFLVLFPGCVWEGQCVFVYTYAECQHMFGCLDSCE